MIKGDKIKVVGSVGKIKPPTNLPTSANPFATLVSTRSTGTVQGYAGSTTGYYKVEWWDGTTNVSSSGWWNKNAGGAGSKTIKIYPSDASGNVVGALTDLYCADNSLTSLDVSGLTALTTLTCFYNSLTSLDVSGLTALTDLRCFYNSLTSLDVSGLTALTLLYCFNNSLTSLRAVGAGALADGYYGSTYVFGGFQLQNNSLSAGALNQFYTDLAAATGMLVVSNNPGTSGDDPTIASAKGWTVYGS